MPFLDMPHTLSLPSLLNFFFLDTWVVAQPECRLSVCFLLGDRLPATVNLSPGLLPNSFSGNFGLGYVDCLAHSLFPNAMRLTFDCRFKLYNSDEETRLPLLGTLDLPPGTEICYIENQIPYLYQHAATSFRMLYEGTLQKKHWVGIDTDLPYKEYEDSRLGDRDTNKSEPLNSVAVKREVMVTRGGH
ncbi:hypothetical protein Pint_22070 [Pistacia integerrima]|uniref:Uncharacterized protein n=1 Tax=Pistacia integerrima TaxID=434235 RepID=A0ACC0YH25_9ROSI|nr:hypothetical protein Pint_22070 [Pistacia integerrima]